MKTVTMNKAKIRIEAKARLTDKQYYGGPGLTPVDHSKVSEVMLLIFGDYSFEVPPVCIAQWGFEAWANYMGWPEIPTSTWITCRSWACKECKHYVEFLTVSSMQDICRNTGNFYEK